MRPASEFLLRFGSFELDPKAGEVRKEGKLIKLQPQPFKVLAFLVTHAGQAVTRKEIEREIWGSSTFVDFDQALNFCIRHIRAALGDDSRKPRYIETLPRRGYRFLAEVGRISRPQSASDTTRVMLVVLPFSDLSGDPEQDYFSDGLTDEMITQLSRLNPERLGVIARTSAMKYKHSQKGIEDIRRELGVHYVLEGSVRREGSRVRITTQLIQVSDQTHVWAETYERDMREILVLQSEVAQAVASEIRLKLTPQEQARLSRGKPVDPRAYEAYLMGRYFWTRRTDEEGLKKGIEYFKRAIEVDPDFAVAYSGLADSFITLLDHDYLPPREAAARAYEAIGTALRLDETLAEAHSSLAHLKMHEWEWADAERAFKRAIELNANYSAAHFYYANFLAAMGRLDEAIKESRRARELDPVSLIVEANDAFTFYNARRYGEAIEVSLKALEIEPDLRRSHDVLGRAYQQLGRHEQAIEAFRKALENSGRGPRYVAALGHAYAVAGMRDEALKLLDELEKLSARRYASACDFALLYTGLGEKEKALTSLWKGYEERAALLTFLKVDPRFDPLRPEPRFKDLVRRIFPPP